LAESKNDEKEGRKARKNPTARLIHRIMEAIETPGSAKGGFWPTALTTTVLLPKEYQTV
jgi:hypothetical protein